MEQTAVRIDTDREFAITRIFHAPRALVFEAWTDPVRMARWWGPHQMTNPVCEMDVRPGGEWRIVMRTPEGEDYPLHGTFLAVDPPERLVMLMNTNEHSPEWHAAIRGAMGDAADEEGREIHTTVTFAEDEGRTTLTIRQRFATTAERDAHVKMGSRQGWGQSMDKLEELLLKP